MINLLTDNLPESVNINGAEIPINTDFRISVQFEMLIQSDIPDNEKIIKALQLYYPKIPRNVERAAEKIIEFYSGNSENNNRKSKSKNAVRPIYSFKHDADYIYSAFMQAYNIDLTTVKMHWYKFRALFKSLPDSCEIVKIMGYRAILITSDMSKKQQEHYRRMKKIYALPVTEKEKRLQNELEKALLNGENICKIIDKCKE